MFRKCKLFAGLIVVGMLIGCAREPVVQPTPAPTPRPPVVERVEEEPTVRGEWQSVPELRMVHFDFDRSEIMPDARGILESNVVFLRANPDLNVLVEGHCDERGTTEYNLALGQRRANEVRAFYGRMGISLGRIATISYGEERPVDLRSDEAGWAINRRAETKVSKR